MSEGVSRQNDDQRLVAVGRALAQSLLSGTESARSSVFADEQALSDHAYIPPPSGTEPGAELMAAPVRRRRRPLVEPTDESSTSRGAAPAAADPTQNDGGFSVTRHEPTGLGQPDDVNGLVEATEPPVQVVPFLAPLLVAEPIIVAPVPVITPVPGLPVADRISLHPFPESTVSGSDSPLPDRGDPLLDVEFVTTDAAFASVSTAVVQMHREDLEPFVVPGDNPEATATSSFVEKLYNSLPWSPDEVEAPSKRRVWGRSQIERGERPTLARPDEATVRLPEPTLLTRTGNGFLAVASHDDPPAISDDRLASEWAGPQSVDHEPEVPAEASRRRHASVEWGMVIGAALIVAVLIKSFLVQSFSIPSESMVATLEVGDRVAVNKLAYDIGGDVERFDVIVFHRVDGPEGPPPDAPEYLIKRVIGLPGETIESRGGLVYVNGKPLDESDHLAADVVTNNLSTPIQVLPGEYFVMGDNRERSGDSRVFGTVPRDKIVGRALAIWWPAGRAGSL